MMNVQANSVFDRQVGRPLWRVMLDLVSHRCRKLFQFKAVVGQSGFKGQHDLGLQVVPVSRIVGTVGRANDFDSAFRPRRHESRQRWVSVFNAMSADKALPPVELFKVGEDYFVEDGHHRVSVARAVDQAYIDAHVIEIDAGHRLPPDASACALER